MFTPIPPRTTRLTSDRLPRPLHHLPRQRRKLLHIVTLALLPVRPIRTLWKSEHRTTGAVEDLEDVGGRAVVFVGIVEGRGAGGEGGEEGGTVGSGEVVGVGRAAPVGPVGAVAKVVVLMRVFVCSRNEIPSKLAFLEERNGGEETHR
jgi:hypothetical protein